MSKLLDNPSNSLLVELENIQKVNGLKSYFANNILLPSEDPIEFQLLREQLTIEYGANGTIEHMLVERIAGVLLKMRRLDQEETDTHFINTHPERVVDHLNIFTNDTIDGKLSKADVGKVMEEEHSALLEKRPGGIGNDAESWFLVRDNCPALWEHVSLGIGRYPQWLDSLETLEDYNKIMSQRPLWIKKHKEYEAFVKANPDDQASRGLLQDELNSLLGTRDQEDALRILNECLPSPKKSVAQKAALREMAKAGGRTLDDEMMEVEQDTLSSLIGLAMMNHDRHYDEDKAEFDRAITRNTGQMEKDMTRHPASRGTIQPRQEALLKQYSQLTAELRKAQMFVHKKEEAERKRASRLSKEALARIDLYN